MLSARSAQTLHVTLRTPTSPCSTWLPNARCDPIDRDSSSRRDDIRHASVGRLHDSVGRYFGGNPGAECALQDSMFKNFGKATRAIRVMNECTPVATNQHQSIVDAYLGVAHSSLWGCHGRNPRRRRNTGVIGGLYGRGYAASGDLPPIAAGVGFIRSLHLVTDKTHAARNR